MAQSPVTEKEARLYYHGLVSCPRLVARGSSTLSAPWEEPGLGPFDFIKRKELRVVGPHELNERWEDNLALLFLELLELNGVMWTSVDVVRIGNSGEQFAPVIIWVGVIPKTLNHVEGTRVALSWKELLVSQGINDVEVEFRESVAERFAPWRRPGPGPKLLGTAVTYDPTVEVRRPVTATLGLAISAQPTAWAEGTGGVYMAEGGEGGKLFLVTARHVVLPPGNAENNLYEYRNSSQLRINALLLGGDAAFSRLVDSVNSEVGIQADLVEDHRDTLKTLEGEQEEDSEVGGRVGEGSKGEAKAALDRAIAAKEKLAAFQKLLKRDWSREADRILGHVLFAPPINADNEAKFTEDFAVIQLDRSKVTMQEINVLDLGAKVSRTEIKQALHPHPTNSNCFVHPPRRLMRLQGIIPTSELRSPKPLATDEEDRGLMVMKRGRTTGLTIGCGSSIFSFVRYYFEDGPPLDSKEWAVLPCNRNFTPFSDSGDSGAVIVDCLGRVGGLITGGTRSGCLDQSDITYATPFEFLLDRIKKRFPNAYIHPVSAPGDPR